MKLFYAQTSPYVRKVMVVAHELGVADKIELVPASVSPIARDAAVGAHNPICKIPTLMTDAGMPLFDSRVICEYLASLTPAGAAIFPAGEARWTALQQQALADGLLDAAILVRYETAIRPEALRWSDWRSGQLGKIAAAADAIETMAPSLGARIDIGTIAIGCALAYLDFRYPELAWRNGRKEAAAWFETFGARPSMSATRPPA